MRLIGLLVTVVIIVGLMFLMLNYFGLWGDEEEKDIDFENVNTEDIKPGTVKQYHYDQMKKNIQDSVDKENEKLEEMLEVVE